MAELKSGVIGCAICIFALMGSIFGASLITAENTDKTITTYNYIADVTGAFDTTQAPEYIDYNPTANYVGYSTKTVNYTDSSTPNAYRYVVSYPQDVSIDRTITESTVSPDSSTDFTPSNVLTRVLINYTGGNELGTSTTSDGLTYNGVVINKTVTSPLGPSYTTDEPTITRLNEILSSFSGYNSSGTIELNITQSGSQPLLMAPISAYTQRTLSAGDENVWNIYHVNITAAPTKIVHNRNTGNVTVYSGSTVLFTETSPNNIDVYYKYQYNMGGTAANATINAVFSHDYIVQDPLTVTNNSSYPNYSPSTTHDLYIYNTTSVGSLPTTSGGTTYGYSYNMYLQYDSNNRGITKLSDIISTFNIPANTHATIRITNNNDPIIFAYSPFTNISATADWVDTTSSNFPYLIDYATDSTLTIYYHPEGSTQTRVAFTGSADNVYVVYKYYISGSSGHWGNVSTTLNCQYTTTETMTITQGSSMTTVPDSAFDDSDAGTMAIVDWNGTYDMGVGGTYAGISYDLVASRFHETGNAYSDRIPDIWTLENYLQTWGLTSFVAIDIEIDLDTDYPVLFYYGNWTRTDNTVGGLTQYVYSATLNENNALPERLHIVEGTAMAYRNGTMIYTAPVSSIYVLNKYSVNTGSGFNEVDTYANLTGFATTDVGAVSTTVNNDSSYPSDAYNFSVWGSALNPRFLFPYMQYTGTQYNNLGSGVEIDAINKTANICLTSGGSGNFTTYNTKLTNILNSMNLSSYDSIDVNLTYGTHPVIFTQGNWEYYTKESSYHDQGGTVYSYTTYYWKQIDDNAFPDRMTYNKATDLVTFYKNGMAIWHAPATNVQVIYKYWIVNSSTLGPYQTAVTDQSVRMEGLGKLHPTYGYANPEFGVTLKSTATTWSNKYENDVINLLWMEQNNTQINNLTITADTSIVSITKYPSMNNVEVVVTKADGTTDTRNFGDWHKGQITIDVTNKTLTFTPITGQDRPNFTDQPIPSNSTSYTWTDWYVGNPIESLTISTTATSMIFGITGTSVFLNTYGVVMFDPNLDIETYFPNMDEWRLNFFSFALVGDSIKINDVTYPVNKADNSITVTDTDGNTITGTLNNVYLTKEIKDNNDTAHYYFTFANSNKSADLGEVTTNTVSFGGMWYFTTGLYELGEGTAKEWTWLPQINLDFSVIALIYIAMVGIALIIGKGVLHADISGLDWVILICSSIIALIIAGGVI